MVNKVQERIYAESAGRLLGADWTVVEIPEPLDFEIQDGENRFGLEVTEIFTGEKTASGSVEKRAEARRLQFVGEIAAAYYRDGGFPVVAKFLGELGTLRPDDIAAAMLRAAPAYPGSPKSTDIAGLRIFMTPIPPGNFGYSRWTYIDDRVGWVSEISPELLQAAVDAKESRLASYKEKFPEIDLLIVADRSFNSGRIAKIGGVTVQNPGFRNIYFLSYPKTIQRVG